MKKTILTVLLCGVLMLGMTGCGKTKNEFDIGDKSDIIILENDVTMSIKDGTLTDTGTTIILTNNSDKLLHYDATYEIEIKQNGEWHKINVELFFNEPLWDVKENKSKEIELNWKNEYGKLATGEYRIIKEVYFENEIEQKFNIAVEFNIDSD